LRASLLVNVEDRKLTLITSDEVWLLIGTPVAVTAIGVIRSVGSISSSAFKSAAVNFRGEAQYMDKITVSISREAAHYLSMLLQDQLVDFENGFMTQHFIPIRDAYEQVNETIERALAIVPPAASMQQPPRVATFDAFTSAISRVAA
jgi:hypothetical protein